MEDHTPLPSRNDTTAPEGGKHAAEATDTPAVSPQARTGVYVACLALNVLAMVGFGLAGTFGWIDRAQGTEAMGVITGATALISSGLALGYRPTRSGT